ncbi:hypothetical protein [Leifsonia aquatica]|uniref:hypothetical protein n=1 Tax=Leifsonia aquatica TaxID=144185 RepID=UPI00046A9591|nr:hypothetical protein [Leifsonia aquatica]
MAETSDIQLGDVVTIADDAHPLTWEVIDINPDGSAYGPLYTLRSGQSGRRRYATEDQISPYRRVTS